MKSQRALATRTSGDISVLQDNELTIGEINDLSSFNGRFLGYNNHPTVLLALMISSTSHRVRRVHHAIVDPFGLSVSGKERVLPHKHLLRTVHADNVGTNEVPTPQEWNVELDPCELDSVSTPFIATECESFDVVIPLKGRLTEISVVTDEDYMLPILHRIDPASDTYNQVQLRHHICKSWII